MKKIGEGDSLTCQRSRAKCVISFIEDQDVIKRILQRRTSPQASGTMGVKPAILPAGKAQSSTPDSQSAALIRPLFTPLVVGLGDLIFAG